MVSTRGPRGLTSSPQTHTYDFPITTWGVGDILSPTAAAAAAAGCLLSHTIESETTSLT